MVKKTQTHVIMAVACMVTFEPTLVILVLQMSAFIEIQTSARKQKYSGSILVYVLGPGRNNELRSVQGNCPCKQGTRNKMAEISFGP